MSPNVRGLPIRIEFLPALRTYRGKLLWGRQARGREVHAGCFLRERRIVLDAALRKRPRELTRILLHELLHFVWLRLGNPRRRAFEDVLSAEMRGRVGGELGWSAERLKAGVTRGDRLRRTRRWREYVCESFCDSGAWLFGGGGRHPEYTLPLASRKIRRAWFAAARLLGEISV